MRVVWLELDYFTFSLCRVYHNCCTALIVSDGIVLIAVVAFPGHGTDTFPIHFGTCGSHRVDTDFKLSALISTEIPREDVREGR